MSKRVFPQDYPFKGYPMLNGLLALPILWGSAAILGFLLGYLK